MDLNSFFSNNPRFAIAFSGGVDSSFLLNAAVAYGCDVTAYYASSLLQPGFELDDVKKLAYFLRVPLRIVTIDVLNFPEITANPADRCYHCKSAIFKTIWAQARTDGYSILCDGTNASDDVTDRPGMRALKELGVISPLRETGLIKSDIRRMSCDAGLFTCDKPSYACLATRIPTGTPLTAELLTKVEKAEDALHALGFNDLRVRYLDGSAKIQIPELQFKQIIDKRTKVLTAVGPYFDNILLDLVPRKTEG